MRLSQIRNFLLLIMLISGIVGCSGGGHLAHFPPTVTIESPRAAASASGILRVSGTAFAQVGYTIGSVSCKVDDAPSIPATGQESWHVDVDTTHFRPGSHRVKITALDNIAEAATAYVDVYINPVAAGNINLIDALEWTSIEAYLDISDTLPSHIGGRFFYKSVTDDAQPVNVGGWVVRPEGDGPFPCIIWNRGGLTGNASSSFLWSLADKGYVAFASDYQGEGALAQGKADLFGGEVYDCIGLLNIARNVEFVDENLIYMWGSSRGSLVTLVALDRLGALGRMGEVRAAAVTSVIYDLKRAASDGYNPLETDIINYFANLKGYSFEKASIELVFRSPEMSYNNDDIMIPVFITHGALDSSFPPYNAQELADDLTSRGIENSMKIYPGEAHDLTGVFSEAIIDDVVAYWNSL